MLDSPILIEDTTVIPLLYFVGAEDRARFPIKIGRSTTKSIGRRLSSMQTGMPYRLQFLVVCEAPPSMEIETHRSFAHLRLEGEWFKPAKELLEFILDVQHAYPAWRDYLRPRFRYGPGHEEPPDNPEDLRRYGVTTSELHWERKKAEMLNRAFPRPTQA